jgi:hypothetical protein
MFPPYFVQLFIFIRCQLFKFAVFSFEFIVNRESYRYTLFYLILLPICLSYLFLPVFCAYVCLLLLHVYEVYHKCHVYLPETSSGAQRTRNRNICTNPYAAVGYKPMRSFSICLTCSTNLILWTRVAHTCDRQSRLPLYTRFPVVKLFHVMPCLYRL